MINVVIDLLLILLVWAVAGIPYLTPNLTGDDWYYLNSVASNPHAWIDLRLSRPMEAAFHHLFQWMWGLDTRADTIATWALWLIVAWVFYGFLRRLLSGQEVILPLVAALIFVIYPAYQPRLWITSSSSSFTLLAALAYAWLLLEYDRRGGFAWLAASLAAYALSLMFFESQTGIVIAWCLFLTLRRSASTPPLLPIKRRWMMMAGTFAVSALALLWRLGLFVTAGSQADAPKRYLLTIQQQGFLPLVWLGRMLDGLRMLVTGWLTPMVNLSELKGQFPMAAALLILAVLLIPIFAWRIERCEKEISPAGMAEVETGSRLRPALVLLLVGIGFSLAGYLPMITVLTPAPDFFTSRVNLYALPGASVMVASALWLVMVLITKRKHRMRMGLLAMALPLVLIGVLFQVEVQHESQRIWHLQTALWQQMFHLTPGFSPGSCVVVVFDHSEYGQGVIRRDVFITPWEVDSAVQLLYDNYSLNGSVLFLDRPDIARFTADGVWISWPERTVPYQQVVIFHYDGNTQKLLLVKDASALWQFSQLASDNLTLDGYDPAARLYPAAPSSNPYRSLINP